MSNRPEHRHPGGKKYGRKWGWPGPWSKAGKSSRRWRKGIDVEKSQESYDRRSR